MENLKKEKDEIMKMKEKMDIQKQEMVYHVEKMRHEMVKAQQVSLIKNEPTYLHIDFNIISYLLHLHIFSLTFDILQEDFYYNWNYFFCPKHY